MTTALLLSLAIADPTVAAVNAERARHGLRPLIQHATLERSSERFAHKLVREGRFAHDARIRVPAGRFTRVGEALARGDRTLSPAAAVRAWMGSPPHRRLLLSSQVHARGRRSRGLDDPRPAPRYALSICFMSAALPAFESGSLRLPHLGDCTQDGQPDSHGHSLTSR